MKNLYIFKFIEVFGNRNRYVYILLMLDFLRILFIWLIGEIFIYFVYVNRKLNEI